MYILCNIKCMQISCQESYCSGGYNWNYYTGTLSIKLLQLLTRWGTCRFHLLIPNLQMSWSDVVATIGCQESISNIGSQATYHTLQQITNYISYLNLTTNNPRKPQDKTWTQSYTASIGNVTLVATTGTTTLVPCLPSQVAETQLKIGHP